MHGLRAGVAQLVEQLTCNQQVTSSSLVASSRECRWPAAQVIGEGREAHRGYGQVAKWLNATDCKSVGSGLRRFESFPAHATVDNCQSTTDNCLWMEMELLSD